MDLKKIAYNNYMRLLSGLLDYSIFARSKDLELFEFCEYFMNYRKNDQWNERQLESMFLPVIQGEVIKEKLSLIHLLKTIGFMRHWMHLSNICAIILEFRNHLYKVKVIDVADGGSIVIKNFRKMDFSISGRINAIISLLELK